MAASSSTKSVAEQIVDVQQAIAGPHPGFRTAHAKGIVCTGKFVASSEAKQLTKAAHLQGQSVPVTLRFSNGSGDPTGHDGVPDVRGLAVKFLLPDGKKTDLLGISNEAFLVRTAEEFLAFLQAQLRDPATGKPNPDAVPKFIQSHPAVGAFVGRLMQKPVPASCAQATYFAINAFRFTAADGSSRFGRAEVPAGERPGIVSPQPANRRARRPNQ
jgi:catalase